MATFHCSVMLDDWRFVSREPFDALCMWDAFLMVSHKYKPLNRFDVRYLVEYRGRYAYYSLDGRRLK